MLAGAGCLPQLPAQVLTVTPTRVLTGESATIRVTGLRPNEPIVIAAGLLDGERQSWESQAEFAAGDDGAVDLSIQAPLKGSYKTVSAMGLIWSMTPASKAAGVYRPPEKLLPQPVRFQLLRDGKTIAAAELEQFPIADGVRQIDLTGQLHGVLFVPAGPAPFPGVLVLGGSEGGLPRRRAAWLASHGFAALALAYFRYENLPPRLEAIPLEYFAQALTWMLNRPEILPNRIAVMGVSRGGELALQLGSMSPQIKAVVAYVPSNVRHRACCGENLVPYAWTWKGLPLAFTGPNQGGVEEARARIAVENAQAPILLIAGEQDHVWDSAGMTKAIVARLKNAHFPYPVEDLVYPHAGHIAGRPEIVPEWHGRMVHPVSGKPMDYGGTPEGNALSSIDAVPKVLDFLRRCLQNPRPQN